MQNSILHNLKMCLALDSEDHYVTAGQVKPSAGVQWFCTSCRCPVKLRNDLTGEDAWFEHAPDETTKALLAECGYLKTEIRKRVFMQRLRSILNSMDKVGTTRYWYCVWCKSHYQGIKHCKTCDTGIYSISRGDWSWNYNQKENKSDINNELINTTPNQTACKPT
ncbi:hypothetical protein C9426_12710 [Serratia sp. S1B]|nr:hypothetical protein C9426_12710 [Serratia sp. S1B]